MNARQNKKRFSLRTRLVLSGLGALFLGWLMSRMPAYTPGQEYWPWFMVSGAVLVIGVAVNVARRRTGDEDGGQSGALVPA